MNPNPDIWAYFFNDYYRVGITTRRNELEVKNVSVLRRNPLEGARLQGERFCCWRCQIAKEIAEPFPRVGGSITMVVLSNSRDMGMCKKKTVLSFTSSCIKDFGKVIWRYQPQCSWLNQFNESVQSVNVWSDAKVLLHMPLLSQLLTWSLSQHRMPTVEHHGVVRFGSNFSWNWPKLRSARLQMRTANRFDNKGGEWGIFTEWVSASFHICVFSRKSQYIYMTCSAWNRGIVV